MKHTYLISPRYKHNLNTLQPLHEQTPICMLKLLVSFGRLLLHLLCISRLVTWSLEASLCFVLLLSHGYSAGSSPCLSLHGVSVIICNVAQYNVSEAAVAPCQELSDSCPKSFPSIVRHHISFHFINSLSEDPVSCILPYSLPFCPFHLARSSPINIPSLHLNAFKFCPNHFPFHACLNSPSSDASSHTQSPSDPVLLPCDWCSLSSQPLLHCSCHAAE
jgi:hypothetical protein